MKFIILVSNLKEHPKMSTDLEEKIKQKILTPEEGVNQDAGTK
jgi:hypothetical protein